MTGEIRHVGENKRTSANTRSNQCTRTFQQMHAEGWSFLKVDIIYTYYEKLWTSDDIDTLFHYAFVSCKGGTLDTAYVSLSVLLHLLLTFFTQYKQESLWSLGAVMVDTRDEAACSFYRITIHTYRLLHALRPLRPCIFELWQVLETMNTSRKEQFYYL